MPLKIYDTVKKGDRVYRVLPKINYKGPDTWEVVEREVTQAGPKTFRLSGQLGPWREVHSQTEIGRYIFKTRGEAIGQFLDDRRRDHESLLRQAEEALHAFRWVTDHLRSEPST